MIFCSFIHNHDLDQLFEGVYFNQLGKFHGIRSSSSAQERKAKLKVIFSVEVGPWAWRPMETFQAVAESPLVVVMLLTFCFSES